MKFRKIKRMINMGSKLSGHSNLSTYYFFVSNMTSNSMMLLLYCIIKLSNLDICSKIFEDILDCWLQITPGKKSSVSRSTFSWRKWFVNHKKWYAYQSFTQSVYTIQNYIYMIELYSINVHNVKLYIHDCDVHIFSFYNCYCDR